MSFSSAGLITFDSFAKLTRAALTTVRSSPKISRASTQPFASKRGKLLVIIPIFQGNSGSNFDKPQRKVESNPMCEMCRCYLYDRFSSPTTYSEKLKNHINRNSLKRCIPMLVKEFEVIFRDLDNMSYFVNACYCDIKKNASHSEIDLHIWDEFISDYSEKENDLKFLMDELIFEGVFRKAIDKDKFAKKFLASHLHFLLSNLYVLHFEHITKTGGQEERKKTPLLTDVQVAMIKSMASNPATCKIPIYKELTNDMDSYNGLYD
jgi:hypothetical protein